MSLFFQLAHANNAPDQDRGCYTIKHYFLRAPNLHHAHVYVTLHGYRITPEFYEDGIEGEETIEHPEYVLETAKQRTLEQYEQMNEECSQGEHYWHSIKQVENYDGQIISLENNGNQLFKLSIQFQCLSVIENPSHGYVNLYYIEQNKKIYQFKATHEDIILQYILQNLNKFSLDNEHLDEKATKCQTWKEFEDICKDKDIQFELEKLEEPIQIIDCQM